MGSVTGLELLALGIRSQNEGHHSPEDHQRGAEEVSDRDRPAIVAVADQHAEEQRRHRAADLGHREEVRDGLAPISSGKISLTVR